MHFYLPDRHQAVDSFPTRRSSDLTARNSVRFIRSHAGVAHTLYFAGSTLYNLPLEMLAVRSEEHTSEPSHLGISYAVFCLKKKNTRRHVSRWNMHSHAPQTLSSSA